VRPSWPGKEIDLRKVATKSPQAISPIAKLLRERRSTRSFDDQRPITVAELSQFLDGTARVLSRSDTKLDLDEGGHTMRPYPSAGAAYELEMRWRRSASPDMSSKRCWREPNTQWAPLLRLRY
jgi:hypothetical protein